MTLRISFLELSDLFAVDDPGDAALAAIDPLDCPHRGTAVTSERGPLTAPCTLLESECGRSVGVGEHACKVCMCHGAPLASNEYFARLVVLVGYQATIAGASALEPKAPTDAEVATALENIHMHTGAKVAERFIEALVWNESITATKGETLLATIEAE